MQSEVARLQCRSAWETVSVRLKGLGVIGATVKGLMRDDKKDLNESLIYATLVANMNNGARIDVQCHMFTCLYVCSITQSSPKF